MCNHSILQYPDSSKDLILTVDVVDVILGPIRRGMSETTLRKLLQHLMKVKGLTPQLNLWDCLLCSYFRPYLAVDVLSFRPITDTLSIFLISKNPIPNGWDGVWSCQNMITKYCTLFCKHILQLNTYEKQFVLNKPDDENQTPLQCLRE